MSSDVCFSDLANETLKLHSEEKIGARIVFTACAAPISQIISNTGLDSSIILEEIQTKQGNFGFNATTEKVEDLLASGVVDPAKVIKNSILFSSSTAGIVLLSEALIGDAPDDESK